MEDCQNVTLICSVNYSGNWAPEMKWQQDGIPVITVGVVNNTVPYKSVTSSLTVVVTRNMTGSKFSCKTYFSEGNKPTSANATNVPQYNYKWMFHIPLIESWFYNIVAAHFIDK